MTIEQDLKEIELKLKKKAFLSFHKDGIIDILIGWNLISIGLFLHTHSILFSFIGLIPLVFYTVLKIRITLPRLGHAQFRTKRTPSMWVIGGIGGILILVAVIYGFFLKGSLGGIGPIALILFGAAFVMVLTSGFNRIFAYALFVPLFFVVGLGLRFLSPFLTIAVGTVVMLSGIWMLVTFIQKNPILDTEELYVSE
jgi:hypothetical protein